MIGKFFITELKDHVLIVTPLKSLGSLTADAIHAESQQVIDQARDQEVAHLVLDMGLTDYFGSNVLEWMVVLWKRIREKDGQVVFCNLNPVAKEILECSRFDTLWPIYKTREEALAAVS